MNIITKQELLKIAKQELLETAKQELLEITKQEAYDDKIQNSIDKVVANDVILHVSEIVQHLKHEVEDCFPTLLGTHDYNEPLEFWVVSKWLGTKLEEQGEAVEYDFHGLVVWGRTTSGKSVSLDAVIKTIVESIELCGIFRSIN